MVGAALVLHYGRMGDAPLFDVVLFGYRNDLARARTVKYLRELPPSLAEIADGVARARREADQAGTKAQRATTTAVKRLTDLGLSRRDAAELLGLSHQRIQQLLEAS